MEPATDEEVVVVGNQYQSGVETDEEKVFITNADDGCCRMSDEIIVVDSTDDAIHPPSIELRTVPSSDGHDGGNKQPFRKAVSFYTLPQRAVDDRKDNDSSNNTTTFQSEAIARKHMKQQRHGLTRTTQSVPRLEVRNGNNNNHHHTTATQEHAANTKKSLREQVITEVTKIVPAGDNKSTTVSKLRRLSLIPPTTISPTKQQQQASTELETNVVVNVDADRNENENTIDDDDDDDDDIASSPSTTSSARRHNNEIRHYRIRSRNTNDRRSVWMLQTELMANGISRFVTWTYRSSFYITILASYVLFMAIMILFAVLIYASGTVHPQCIFVGGGSKGFTGHFMDAVHLSWTTLGTVGYGAVGPVVPGENRRCIVINLLMAFESFLGVLFGGFASAIIIGKMARYQSVAHVSFSNRICIKYGTAAILDDDDDEDIINVQDDETITDSDPSSTCIDPNNEHPFPVMEIRMINKLSREKGGEILNAHVSVVASVIRNDCETKGHVKSLTTRNASSHSSNLVNMAAETSTHAAKMVGTVGTSAVLTGTKAAKTTVKYAGAALTCARKLTKGGSGSMSAFQQVVHQLVSTPNEPYTSSTHDPEAVLREMASMAKEQQHEIQGHVYVDEGNSVLAPPRTYHKLQVETDRHPYFKRVWNIRHVLDDRSPILSEHARDLIRSNNGVWPTSLSDAESVRKCLCLNDIIISFSGTSNASCRSVYGQKVYESTDIRVGYTFANVLALVNNRIVVDMGMLHEISEQIGGGAERELDTDSDDDNVFINAAKNINAATNVVGENIGAALKSLVR